MQAPASETLDHAEQGPTLRWSTFCIAVAVILLPLAIWGPFASDLPMHAARVSIFMRQNLPLFHDAYRFHMVPLPNLAFDLAVPAWRHHAKARAIDSTALLIGSVPGMREGNGSMPRQSSCRLIASRSRITD